MFNSRPQSRKGFQDPEVIENVQVHLISYFTKFEYLLPHCDNPDIKKVILCLSKSWANPQDLEKLKPYTLPLSDNLLANNSMTFQKELIGITDLDRMILILMDRFVRQKPDAPE